MSIFDREFFTPPHSFPSPEPPLNTPSRQKFLQAKLEGAAQSAKAAIASERAPDKKRYRILRFIEYTGSLEWVNDCIARRGVKGTRDLGGNEQNVIREGILGDAAELLAAPKPDTSGLRVINTELRKLRDEIAICRRVYISTDEAAHRLTGIIDRNLDAIRTLEGV